MSEISGKVVLQVIEGVERFAIDGEVLVRSAGLEPRRLAASNHRVTWEEFVALHRAAAELGLDSEDFVALGRGIPRLPSGKLLPGFARHLVSVRQLLRLAQRWLAPALFPVVKVRQRDLPDGGLEFVLEIPADRPGSADFFRINKGVMEVAPTLFGWPEARVDAEIGDRRAVLRVRLQQEVPLLRRLTGGARAALSTWRLVNEISRHQDDIARAERALSRARRDSRQLIELLPEAVLVWRARQLVYANRAGYRLLEIASDDVAGADLQLEDFVHREDLALAERVFKTGEASAVVELRLVGRDGKETLCELSKPQEIDFEGARGLLLVARDIGRRRRLEEDLAHSRQLAALGRLVANVSHELANPLAYVDLNLAVIDRILGEGLAADKIARMREAVVSAREGSARASVILRGLSSLSRRDEGARERVDLRQVTAAAAVSAAAEIAARARLVTNYEPVAPVRAVRTRLEQVVLNLLVNAAQAFASADRVNNLIELRLGQDGGFAILEVEDNAGGIAAANRDRVFDPFFTTKPRGSGTGLGLAICRDIVNNHGGEITVDSVAGVGTCFTVRLPCEVASAGVEPPRAGDGGPARVLIVDDEPGLAEVLDRVLTAERHEVVVASSGESALAVLAEDSEFDIILCDLTMRGMSGVDVYARLEHSYPELLERVTFMTGGAHTREASSFLARLPNLVLEKPFEFERVVALVAGRPS